MRNSLFAIGFVCSICLSTALPASTLHWDPTESNGTAPGGTGNWDQVSPNWFNAASDVIWNNNNNDDAVFSGTSGTITLTENIGVDDIYFTNVEGIDTITNATGAETLTLGNGVIDTGGKDHVIGALLGGSTTLNINGAGILELSGNNSGFGGSINVNSGVLEVENVNALGAGQTAATNGAALEFTPGGSFPNNFTVSGTGISNAGVMLNITNANLIYGATTLASTNIQFGSSNGTLDFYGGISTSLSSVNLTVSGAGAVRVDAGGLNLGTGTLTEEGLGSLSVAETSLYPTVFSNLVVTSNGTYNFNSDVNLGTVPSSLFTNEVRLDGGTLGSSGTFTISATRGITVTTNGGTIAVNSGTLTTGNIYSQNTDVSLTGGAMHLAWNTGGVVNLGTGRLIRTATADLNNGASANTFSGLVITGSSYSWSTSDAGLGTAPAAFNPSNIVLNGGSLHSSHTYTMNGNRGIYLNTNGGSIDVLTSSATLSIPGTISGPGTLEIIKGNTSVNVKFTANNTYTGATTIDSGANLIVGNNGSVGTLGTGNVIDNSTLTFSRSDSAYSYGGIISGSGAMTVSGSGTVTLTGNNTYSGNTSVNSGGLVVNNTSGSGTGTGNVTVSSGATLGGTGIIGGAVTVNAGGTLAPGNATPSVGTLTIDNSLSLAGNVAIAINKSLSPSCGNVVVIGSLANSGSGVVKITNLGSRLAAGDKFQVLNQPVTGNALQVTGGGAIWANNLAVDGTISVVSVPVPVINSAFISGTNIVLAGTNGYPSDGYVLLSSTNVALPITNWTHVLTNSYDGSGNFSVTNAITTNVPQQFYLLQSR
jgi:fibronectin-binding autotransporter adhesin